MSHTCQNCLHQYTVSS